MAVYIPMELIFQILFLLPSKSLLRCRSVCKSWLSLISSTQFKLLHLHNFNQLNSRSLVRRVLSTEKKEIYTLHLDDQHFTQDTSSPIEFPFNLQRRKIEFFTNVGCCNGVICLADDKSDEIILWNPSIRRKITLIPPMYRNNSSQELSIVFGFGYLKMSDDYKVVRLAYDSEYLNDYNGGFLDKPATPPTPQVEIYTFKTAIWRAIEFPHDLSCNTTAHYSQLFLNGSVHWLACVWDNRPRCSILTLDMKTELFGKIKLPEGVGWGSPSRLALTIFGDCLGVIDLGTYYKSSIHIWVMKEYEKPNSWTMIYNMRYPDNDKEIPLGLRNNGDLMTISTQGDMEIYDQEGFYYVFGSCNKGIVLKLSSVCRYQESLELLNVKELDDD